MAESLISTLADEIDQDLDVQIRELERNGVGNLSLRSAWGKGVLDLTPEEVRKAKRIAADNGIGFSGIGSPLGKFPLSGEFQEQLDGLARALEYAQIVEAPYIRIFSFWQVEGDDPAIHRNQVIDWLSRMLEMAEATPVKLGHENEKGIYGDTGDRVLDLHQSITSPSFVAVFDFANYVQCGQNPYEDCWIKIKDNLGYFHIKDALLAGGTVVPAGQGDGDVGRILAEAFADGFSDYLTIEPHLFSGGVYAAKPEAFAAAVGGLYEVLDSIPGANEIVGR